MYSLRHRLGKSLLLNLLLIMVLLLIGLNYMILELVRDHSASRLQLDADGLVSDLHRDLNGNWQIDPMHVSAVYRRVRSGHYYRIDTPSGDIRSRSLFDFEFQPRQLKPELSSVYRMTGPGDEEWLVWQQKVNKDGDDILIWIAEDLSPVYRDMRHFSLYALALIVVSTLVAFYSQQRILSRSFQVFERLREGLNRHVQGERSLEGVETPREVSPLVGEIDQLVQDLRHRTQRSRNAIANLAHELKRPLQILSLRFDMQDKHAEATRALTDIQAVIDRELRRARLSGSDRIGGHCDLSRELPHLLDMTARIYPDVAVNLEQQSGIPALPYDRGDVLELVGNLLDNACKFASTHVQVEISSDSGRFLLCIDDDGPGVSDGDMNELAKTGFRVDESVQGHGLGLGLCADIVDSFHGTMRFCHSSLGGLRVEVTLPWRNRNDSQ